MSSFQLVALSPAPFAPLFSLTSHELSQKSAVRVTATSKPGYPCRVSLIDAEPGEELLLLRFEHQPEHTPYRSCGPIFVRPGAEQRTMRIGEVPASVSMRQISLRAYDVSHMIIAAEVCPGENVGAELERLFSDPLVSYIHLHNAKRGCYSCCARRATELAGET